MNEKIYNETIELLLSHSSVRKFLDKDVPEDVVDTIISCGQMAPTSSYLQAYTIIRVNDEEKKKALAEYAGGQEWVVKAPLVLLFCADLHRLDVLAKPKDENVLHNTELFTVSVIDAALAAGKALTAAQALGLGVVTVGGVRNETEKMAKLFNLPELVFPMFLLCLGYPAEAPAQRPRLPKEIICGQDEYPSLTSVEANNAISAYEEDVRQFFLNATNGRSDRSWSTRCQYAIEKKPRYELTDFLSKAGFMTAPKDISK